MEALIPLLIYGGIGTVLVVLGVVFYMRAVSSRKFYVCPECGERVRVELMEAARCNTCGAPLARSDSGD